MAALNTIAREWADELREGIAWVIVWKTGRSWNAQAVWLSYDDDTFEPEDLELARKVLEQDPNAVMLNGYYCGHLGEKMTVAEIIDGIRWHYDRHANLLKDSSVFPPEPIPRPADLPADLPWYGKETSAKPDPYIFDGYMSVEDFERMHELIAADRQQEAETVYAEACQAREGFWCWERPRLVSGELYLDGKPLQFAEATLPDISVGDLSRVPPNNAPELGSMELTLPITSQAAAAIAEVIRSAFERFIHKAKKVIGQIAEVFRTAAKVVGKTVREVMDALLYAANEHPKWWYLYKHAKKYRVRKKYRRRLEKQLYSKLLAAASE